MIREVMICQSESDEYDEETDEYKPKKIRLIMEDKDVAKLVVVLTLYRVLCIGIGVLIGILLMS